MIIELTKHELERCIEFSYKCAKNQQEIEFGQSDTIPRSHIEIGRDNLIGKIAEVAFSKMMDKYFGIMIALDFEYYPRGVWDKQDAIINGWRIDVKGTRQGGRWMLIEWSKLNFRQKEGILSHLYIMSSVNWDRVKDFPTGKVDIVGWASLNRLVHCVNNTLVLRKGSCIPKTNTRLQADNFGIHFDNLEHDWNKVIQWITNNPAFDTSGYPNPYNVF
ncbi:hypothetical protein ABER61_00505 [Brevibacillus formosus]|uniref:Uncharacterized protein n=1 Tax=Brevibacillus formosus TaxID=54913 RepID=A0A837KI26_9BACL|nr:hypothetical protein [Brevibacillus formosus]KLH97410.1 hypothetical protein AA984_19915 [Brevibacillus formosus]MED1958265.1 hypothetical protein [Brevibacillus formosus]PSJ96774.1 hypothetical protein C7R91_10985 [Brevibacillus formosus]GED59949.1 hypothetical protein BFO01nite_40810 [Brevibacillus formosus]